MSRREAQPVDAAIRALNNSVFDQLVQETIGRGATAHVGAGDDLLDRLSAAVLEQPDDAGADLPIVDLAAQRGLKTRARFLPPPGTRRIAQSPLV